MSQLEVVIREIESVDNLNIVTFDFYGVNLKMMSLDLNDDVQIGSKVILGVKPSAVAIAKNFDGQISDSNQIDSKIESIEKGKLLCSIKLSFKDTVFESIITLDAANRLMLKEKESVTVFIKANEFSIVEVLDD